MHGRLKVKTTAEQEATKNAERKKKIEKYTAATQSIFKKRSLGPSGLDMDLLDTTGQLLGSNPDFYTLWNIRREIFEDWTARNEECGVEDAYEKELGFLEQCLRVNPKSYGCWNHRCWVMDHMRKPDWKNELSLCNKYLEYDERNFHCWDYRRFVVSRSNVSPESEFKFTTEKISSNFSNYSSWHYRSKLLPVIHPDPSHPVGVKEEVLLQEFELAQNAFFTDPNDQSAWFYHRWLLGRGERPLCIETAIVDRDLQRCVIILNKEVKQEELDVAMTVDSTAVQLHLSHIGDSCYSKMWQAAVTDSAVLDAEHDHIIKLCLSNQSHDDQETILTLNKNSSDTYWRRKHKPGTRFNYELSAATSDILTQELESCQQLHELEPDNKWTQLTIVLLMRAVNPLKYETQTFEFIEKLEDVDPTRRNYYRDMRSKFVIENAIERLDDENREVDLSGKGLTVLYHMDLMAHLESVNLSGNDVMCNFGELRYLQCAKTLKVDHDVKDSAAFQEVLCELPKLGASGLICVDKDS